MKNLFFLDDSQRPRNDNKSICPEYWEPNRHNPKEAITNENLNTSRDKKILKNQHSKKSYNQYQIFSSIILQEEARKNYQEIDTAENPVILNQRDESNHQKYWKCLNQDFVEFFAHFYSLKKYMNVAFVIP